MKRWLIQLIAGFWWAIVFSVVLLKNRPTRGRPVFHGLISRILYEVVIYLDLLSPKGSSDLPTGSDEPPYRLPKKPAPAYLVLQPIRFTRVGCRHPKPWALTSRFHPYPAENRQGGSFLWYWLWTKSCPFAPFPLGSMVPCAVLTFLDVETTPRQRWPWTCKNSDFTVSMCWFWTLWLISVYRWRMWGCFSNFECRFNTFASWRNLSVQESSCSFLFFLNWQ